MADEVVYRILQGANVTLTEDAASKTVTVAVPGLDGKINIGDIGQATQVSAGIVELATDAETRSGADNARAITPANLGSLLQPSTYDSTAGNILRVGAFGLGGGINSIDAPDLNAIRPTAFYYVSNASNQPVGVGGDGWLVHIQHTSTGYASQIYAPYGNPGWYFRIKSATVWGAWRLSYDTANFDPASKANTSGNYPSIIAGGAANLTDSVRGNHSGQDLSPSGMIAHFARPSAPSGWLEANGAAVSRTTYQALFNAIGTTYGAGNGSSTFNLPDLRGTFVRGWDNGRGVDPSRSFATTQQSGNLQHSHTGSTATAGTHSHGTTTGIAGAHSHSTSMTTDGSHQHTGLQFTGSTDDNGDIGAFVVMTPNQAFGVATPQGGITGAAGAHSHTVTINNSASHIHNIIDDGVHSHVPTIDPAGGSESRPVNIALLACIKI